MADTYVTERYALIRRQCGAVVRLFKYYFPVLTIDSSLTPSSTITTTKLTYVPSFLSFALLRAPVCDFLFHFHSRDVELLKLPRLKSLMPKIPPVAMFRYLTKVLKLLLIIRKFMSLSTTWNYGMNYFAVSTRTVSKNHPLSRVVPSCL